ncbi:MAG: glycosyltransferase family 9 protein [Desulfobaccales bacterium]
MTLINRHKERVATRNEPLKRQLFRIIDAYFGLLITFFLYIFGKTFGRTQNVTCNHRFNKILLVKLAALGESTILLTVIDRIKKACPQAEIHVLATPLNSQILEQNSHLYDRLIVEDILKSKLGFLRLIKIIKNLRKSQYDLAIDFEPHFYFTPVILYLSNIPVRGGFYYLGARRLLLTNAWRLSPQHHILHDFYGLAQSILPLPPPPHRLVAPRLRPENRHNIQRWLQAKGLEGRPYVVLHPGCGPSGRCRAWPKERFLTLAQFLAQNDYVVFLSGTNSEKDIINFILSHADGAPIFSLMDELSFADYVALLDEAKLMVANDTGPMHLGAALRVPTLGLFGPETPGRYGPFGPGNHYLYIEQPCSPCTYSHRGIRPHCINLTYQKCMLDITDEMVKDKVKEILHIK